MLVQCTGCNTTYKIADQKVPPGGVKVKCPKCRVVFLVRKEVESEPETLGEKLFGKDVVRRPFGEEKIAHEKVEAEEGPATEEKTSESQENIEKEPAPSVEETAFESTREAIGETEKETVRETVREMVKEMVGETVVPQVPPISSTEPEAIASSFQPKEEDPRNLARALISDVLFYNRDKRDKGLEEGKVLAYLGREIARSWELYKERVGIEKALGTDCFREAVNDILGESREIL